MSKVNTNEPPERTLGAVKSDDRAEHQGPSLSKLTADSKASSQAAFTGWVETVGRGDQSLQGFRAHYLGSWSTLSAFGRQFAQELGLNDQLADVPARLRPYVHIDSEALVADMLLAGEIDCFEDGIGVTHVFLAVDDDDVRDRASS